MEKVDRELKADLLIVGGGGAGLRAAIEAARAGARVILVSKGPLCRSGATVTASFSIQAAFDPRDSSRLHFEDTVRVGRGLAEEPLVKALAEDAPERLLELSEMDTPFERLEGGRFRQVQLAGQSLPRSLVISRCAYGLMVALARELARYREVEVWEDAMAVSLLSGGSRVSGALVFDIRTGELALIRAGATLLATGGYMALWSFNDAPPDLTGEGQVLALRAGAELIDLEMMQFYPTVICHPPGARGHLFSYDRARHPEMLGGRILNGLGETFFEGRPTRDELLRLILKEVAEGRGSPHGGVFIDLTHSPHPPSHVEKMLRQTPAAFGLLRQLGVDMRKEPFEVAPGAHFACGGV
ncbi:MAG: FAD-dependent oxidoreductase, partial [Nitrospinota bacterium]